ncbi:BPL-N domain-containing protein [Aneurinibacillus sp. Ricciae_BoGa-3]|uniref:BPL-N domain-containing protein n=1 Tax=Aneurinibacillus sp. Ricciae_BoGa-3 TaxID=3022697 RepID=UPI00234005D6|nr:BPL-N domain-containing protein [Aneurinibacillus sp. Ricciae_BoGa-3]WCK54228.1 BPL-N domain-containing protein [Aneurinibacillus sp. Ricciae_BoGa-3]
MKLISVERLGVINRQASLPRTLSWINRKIRRGTAIYQSTRDVRLATSAFPEGHTYPAGTLLADVNEVPEYVYAESMEAPVDSTSWRRMRLPVKMAIYNGLNAAPFCFDPYKAFCELYDLPYREVTDKDIRDGALSEFDLFIVPGGPDAGESYYAGLGEKGMLAIRAYLESGGKYLGSCAGAYLPLTAKPGTPEARMWLNAVEATDTSALDYWRTGTGFVRIRLSESGSPYTYGLAYGSASSHDVIYWEGPVFETLGEGVKVIATYEEFLFSGAEPPKWEMHNNSCAKDALAWTNPLTAERFANFMKHKPAAIEAHYGKGKLVLYSFHPEFGTPNLAAWKDSVTHLFIMNGIYELCS